jgi:hypothetical protein
MEAACSSETSVTIRHSTRRHLPATVRTVGCRSRDVASTTDDGPAGQRKPLNTAAGVCKVAELYLGNIKNWSPVPPGVYKWAVLC